MTKARDALVGAVLDRTDLGHEKMSRVTIPSESG
jgi:hypothetical protein